MSKAKTNVYWVVNVLLVVLQQETQCLLLCRDFNQQQQPMQSDINNIGNSGANLHINDVSIQPLKVTFFRFTKTKLACFLSNLFHQAFNHCYYPNRN